MDRQGFQLYDTTLRDGTRRKGRGLTVDDKLALARDLDAFGVGFIEGGRPGTVPLDTEFFRRARTELSLNKAQLTAFGATRKPGALVSTDPQVRALIEAGTPVVTLVAESHPGHVRDTLRTTLAENLAMIDSTVRHLALAGRRVFVDADHYFEGYTRNRLYALEVVRTAAEAGAETVVLCDASGAVMPDEIAAAVADTARTTGVRIGIQCRCEHGGAVAGTLAAVDAGAGHVRGTVPGLGAEPGDADLFTIAASLLLRRGVDSARPAGGCPSGAAGPGTTNGMERTTRTNGMDDDMVSAFGRALLDAVGSAAPAGPGRTRPTATSIAGS